ncbi:hypothetical protein Fmac_005104 [Flemingia macrophylla]|uniref:LMBR1-like membrane protein n=1 Tax=Flemingia macrophylla TaxID=520843 RepID=A0ABD1N6U3_9FABA
MVIVTLKYFSGPHVPNYVFFTVAYTWFCSLSIIILVPADIWTALNNDENRAISLFWSLSYWSTFLLTCNCAVLLPHVLIAIIGTSRAVVPTIQGYEDAGDFTVKERLKASLHGNLVFYLCVGSVALFGVILLISLHKNYWSGNVTGFAMACSNTFGLVTGAFLLGFGLSEIPKGIWLHADWAIQQKVFSHKVAKMAVKLDEAHHDFSNAIVITQATSKQMSKRDSLRPYMNIIDKILLQMLKEDPSFKPQGGRLGESDMDYDTDEKSMAALRRRLKRARDKYYRYRSEYTNFVLGALELEDTVKNYDRRDTTGWKYISCLRPERMGKVGALLDTIAEATILTSEVDLSVFSILVHAAGQQEGFVQKMGKINDAVPFFGRGFNKIYPLIMVIYTSLVAANIFNRIIQYCGNWKIFKLKDDAEDMDGYDPSGVIILQRGEFKPFQALDEKATRSDTINIVEEKNEGTKNDMSRKFGSKKYSALRTNLNEEVSSYDLTQERVSSSLSSDVNDSQNTSSTSSSVLASKWDSMMHGFKSLRSNIDSKGFLPLSNAHGSTLNSKSSFESLDDIFERLKRPPSEYRDSED